MLHQISNTNFKAFQTPFPLGRFGVEGGGGRRSGTQNPNLSHVPTGIISFAIHFDKLHIFQRFELSRGKVDTSLIRVWQKYEDPLWYRSKLVCREGLHGQSHDVRVSRVYGLVDGFRAIAYFLAGDTSDEIPNIMIWVLVHHQGTVNIVIRLKCVTWNHKLGSFYSDRIASMQIMTTIWT